MPRKKAAETKIIVRELNAKETINSGATLGDNDAVIDRTFPKLGYRGISVEIKVTDAKSYSLKRAILEKTRKEANISNRMPVMVVKIQDRSYAILQFEDFMGLIEEEK